jgi:hypothetical protein
MNVTFFWKGSYPDIPTDHGPAYTGIANAHPETKAQQVPKSDLNLPLDPAKVMQKSELLWQLGLYPRVAD